MKNSIKIELIDSNPHRDLTRNPLSPDQVNDVSESIKRTGFWDNLVVRPVGDRYQLAYGHNRLAALKQLGIEEAGFSIRELSDFDMLNCMIDENETQRQITPTIIFENLTAAVCLGEQMLNASVTVEEFNDRLKTSNCSPANKCFDPEYFTRAKSQLASGEGLGRGFLLHFLGERKSMSPATVQTVLDTYYAESRKVAAEKRRKEQERIAAEKAKEQEAQNAEAERKRAEKEEAMAEAQRKEDARREAQRKAKEEQDAKRKAELEVEVEKAQEAAAAAHRERQRIAELEEDARKAALEAAKARSAAEAAVDEAKRQIDRLSRAGISQDILEQFTSVKAMTEFANVVKKENIPANRHKEFLTYIQEEELSANKIREEGPSWWDKASGAFDRRMRQIEEARIVNDRNRRFANGDVDQFLLLANTKLDAAIRDLEEVAEAFTFANETLKGNSTKKYKNAIEVLQKLIDSTAKREAVINSNVVGLI